MSHDDAGRIAFIDGLRTFLTQTPTSYHVADVVSRRLVGAGFIRLAERDAWPAEPGRYVVVRDGAVIAWVVPRGAAATAPVRIIGAHTDSPMLRLKDLATDDADGWRRLSVEIYGGALLPTWLDRDLAIAGRVFDRTGRPHLVRTGPIARVPSLAIHLDRGQNDDLRLDRQRDLQPVLGAMTDDPDLDVAALVASRAGLEPGDLAGGDLFLVDTQPPQLLGAREELLAAGRLDNLSSMYAGLAALLAIAGGVRGERLVDTADHVTVLAAFDHEEVGSGTRSGAAGPLLEQVLVRVAGQLGADEEQRLRAWADSWVLSADAGHLTHPNRPDRHDPARHPLPGRGPLLKVNANQRYASDGAGAALWHGLARAAGVAVQTFVSNNAVPCGTTIGPITATRLGMRTVDVGVGLLSMHSIRELCHVGDLRALSQIMAAFALSAEEAA